MNLRFISTLRNLVETGGHEETVEEYEDIVVERIKEFVREESFYDLPTNEILKIIGACNIEDIRLLCELASRMSANKGEESALLLNVIKSDEATLEECIRILSRFKQCPLCQRTGRLFNEDRELTERDFEHENEELKKEIEKLQSETKEEKKLCFYPVTEKPIDFESDICKAAERGKLESVQYLVEQCHANVEVKGEWGCTPLNIASKEGHLDVVAYLHELCHANVETKDNYGYAPINNASLNGHLDIVKYLYEVCHADVETKDIDEYTPLNFASFNGHFEIVKYLHEICHANIETKDSIGRTPIRNASESGHLEIVKYLNEICHAKITEETIENADPKCKKYLLSK